jgi:hypothetical protein
MSEIAYSNGSEADQQMNTMRKSAGVVGDHLVVGLQGVGGVTLVAP